MPTSNETPAGSWTRPTTFFWAALGATFGLANVWQFPYLASQHGGSLFILLYLACLLLVTLPLMVTEAAMGRYARHGLVLAMDGYVRNLRCSRWWVWAGRLGVIAAFLVLSFTAVFGAIALAYVFYGAIGRFIGEDRAGAADILAKLVSEPSEYRAFMAWHGFFLILVCWVSMQGVVNGLERAFRTVAPAVVLLVVGFCIFAAWQGDFSRATSVILSIDRDALTLSSLQAALFHAFFTLGLGMGVWTLFGAYTPEGTQLKRSILAVVLMDTLVAIAAGLAIYSLVLAGPGLAGEQGFGLLFMGLPVAVSELPGSQFILVVVFLLIVMVVWTTSLSLLEPVVGWFRGWTGAPRQFSVLIIGLSVWLVGLGSLLSFNVWSELRFYGGTFFRWAELFAGGLLVPLVSILVAVFAGWYLTRSLAFRILGRTPKLFAEIWFWVMRLVLPVVVVIIALQYSSAGLMAMCDQPGRAFWCGAPTLDGEAGDETGPGSQVPGPEGSQSDGEPLPGKESEQMPEDGQTEKAAPSDENATDSGEILYHSA